MLTSYALSMIDDYGICSSRTQTIGSPSESRARLQPLWSMDRQTGLSSTTNVRIAAFTAANALSRLGTWLDPKVANERG